MFVILGSTGLSGSVCVVGPDRLLIDVYQTTTNTRLDDTVFSPGVCPGLTSPGEGKKKLLHERPAQKESDPKYEQRTELNTNIQKPTISSVVCVTLTEHTAALQRLRPSCCLNKKQIPGRL